MRPSGDSAKSHSHPGNARNPTSLSRKSVRVRKLCGMIIGTTQPPRSRPASADATWCSWISGMRGLIRTLFQFKWRSAAADMSPMSRKCASLKPSKNDDGTNSRLVPA